MNDHVHPVFKEALKAMSDNLPCRVSADLARHEASLRDAEHMSYDEHDEALMHDVVANKRLEKPIQELLLTLSNLEAIYGSFGEPDKARAFDRILPELKALKEGFIDAMRDL